VSEVKAVEFRAEVRQIKTMADRSINVILNLPEDCTEQAKALMDWLGLEVNTLIVSPDSRGGTGDGSRTRRKRKVQEGD
jgi:hypothetical protein